MVVFRRSHTRVVTPTFTGYRSKGSASVTDQLFDAGLDHGGAAVLVQHGASIHGHNQPVLLLRLLRSSRYQSCLLVQERIYLFSDTSLLGTWYQSSKIWVAAVVQ